MMAARWVPLVAACLLVLSLGACAGGSGSGDVISGGAIPEDYIAGNVAKVYDYLHVVSVDGETVRASVLRDGESQGGYVHALEEGIAALDVREVPVLNHIGLAYAVGLDRFEPTGSYVELEAPVGVLHDDDILRIEYTEKGEVAFVAICASLEMDPVPDLAETAERPPASLVGRA